MAMMEQGTRKPDTRLENTYCICHSPGDVDIANDVKSQLMSKGFQCKLSTDIDDFVKTPSTFLVLITREFCANNMFINGYKARMLDKDFKRRVVPIVCDIPDNKLPSTIKNMKHLNLKQRNFITRLVQAVQGGGIESLVPRISVKIKPVDLYMFIYAMVNTDENNSNAKSSDQSIHDIWEDVYQARLVKVEEKNDFVLLSVAVREKLGLQKLALDSNDGTLKKRFVEKLVESSAESVVFVENVKISFDMKEYTTACEQLKEDEEIVNSEQTDGDSSSYATHGAEQVEEARGTLENASAKGMSFEGSDSYGSNGRRRSPKNSDLAVTDTSGAGPQALDGVGAIISGILFTMISKKDYSCYDFESQLHKLFQLTKTKIEHVISEEGTNLLHAAVLSVRPTFLPILFRNGFWPCLIHMKVDRNKHSQWGDLTAKEIAEKRGRSRKLLSDIVYYSSWEKSLSELHLAARSGDENMVKSYISNGATVNEKDNAGATPLYWACVSGKESLVQYLLEKGAKTTVVTDKGETLLHLATSMGHKNIVRLFLQEKYGMDPNVKDSSKKTAWERNGESGDIETLQVYVERGKEIPVNVLPAAAFHGRLKYIKKVIEDYKVASDGTDLNGRNALLRATESGHVEIVKYLLEQGVDLQSTDKRGRSVLHILADGGYESVLPVVLKKAKELGCLPQLINQRDKYVGGELCFLIRGKDKGRQAWHYVEVKRRLVHIFLKKTRGGSVDVAIYGNVVKSGWGPDPEQEIIDMIDRRFEERRQSNTTESDQTALHIALFKSNDEIAQTLIEEGADLSVKDSFDLTPLHIAAMRGNLEMAKLMDSKGASQTVEDKDGKTPLEVAEDNEHHEITNFLKAKDYYSRSEKFVNNELPDHTQKMSRDYLEKLRREGKDVRKHLIDVLRDITIDVHGFLLDLGSGPVQEESSAAASMY